MRTGLEADLDLAFAPDRFDEDHLEHLVPRAALGAEGVGVADRHVRAVHARERTSTAGCQPRV
jgi:hypothetical protein